MALFAGWGLRNVKWFRDFLDNEFGLQINIDDLSTNSIESDDPFIEVHNATLTNSAVNLLVKNQFPVALDLGKASKLQIQFSWQSILQDDPNPAPFEVRIWDARIVLRITHPNEWEDQLTDMFKSLDKTNRRTLDGYYLPDNAKWHVRIANRVKKLLKLSIHNCSVTIAGPNAPTKLPFLISLHIDYIAYCDPDETAWNGRGRLVRKCKGLSYCGRESSKHQKGKCIPHGQQCDYCKVEPKCPPTFKFDKKMRDSMLRPAKVCYIRDASLYIHMGQVHITRFISEHPGDILPKASLKTPKMMIMIQMQKCTDWSQVVPDESCVVSQINVRLDFEDPAQNEVIFTTADWDLLMHLIIGPYCVLNAYFAFTKKSMATTRPPHLSAHNAQRYKDLWKRHLDNYITRKELTELKQMEDAMPVGFAFHLRNNFEKSAQVSLCADKFAYMCTESERTASMSSMSALSTPTGVFPCLNSTRVFHGSSSQWSKETRAKQYPEGTRVSGYSYQEIYIPQLYLRIVPLESGPRRGCRCKEAFDYPNLVRLAFKEMRIGNWKDFTGGAIFQLEWADLRLSEKVDKEWKTVFMSGPNDGSDRASFSRADYVKKGHELAREMHIVGRFEGNLRTTLEIVQFLWMGHMPSFVHLKTEFRMRKRLPHWWTSVCEGLIPARDQDFVLNCDAIEFYITLKKDRKSNVVDPATSHFDATKSSGHLLFRVIHLKLDTALMRQAELFSTQYAVSIDSCVKDVYGGTLIADKATHLLQEDVVIANPVEVDKKVTFRLVNGNVSVLSGPWYLHGATYLGSLRGLDTVFIEGRTPWLVVGALTIGEGKSGIVQKPHIFAITANPQYQPPMQSSHIREETAMLGTSDAILGLGKWLRISNTLVNYEALSDLKPLTTVSSRYDISDLLGYPQDETIVRAPKDPKPISIELSLCDTSILLVHDDMDVKTLSVTFIELSVNLKKIEDHLTVSCELRDMLIETEEAYDASRVPQEAHHPAVGRTPESSIYHYMNVRNSSPDASIRSQAVHPTITITVPASTTGVLLRGNKSRSTSLDNAGPPLFSRAVTHKTDGALVCLDVDKSAHRMGVTLQLAHAQFSLTTHTVKTLKLFVENVKAMGGTPDGDSKKRDSNGAMAQQGVGSAADVFTQSAASKRRNVYGTTRSSSWVSFLGDSNSRLGDDPAHAPETRSALAVKIHVQHLLVLVPGKRGHCYEPASTSQPTRPRARESVPLKIRRAKTQKNIESQDPTQVAKDEVPRRVIDDTLIIILNVHADIENGGSSGLVVTSKATEVSLWHVKPHDLILSIILSDVVTTPSRSSLRIGHCAWWAAPNPQKCAMTAAGDSAAKHHACHRESRGRPISESHFQHFPSKLPWATETQIFERAPLLWPVLWHEVMHHLGGYLWKMRIDKVIVASYPRLCDSTTARGPQLITVSKATPQASFRPKYVVEDIGLTTAPQSNAGTPCTAMHHTVTFEFRPVESVAEAYYVNGYAGLSGGWLNNARPDGDLSIVTPDPLESLIVKVVPVESKKKAENDNNHAPTSLYRMKVIDVVLPAREPMYIGTRSDGTLTTFRDPAQACEIELVGSGLSDEVRDAWLTICLEDEASGRRRVLSQAVDPGECLQVPRTTSSDTLIPEELSVPPRVDDSWGTLPTFRGCSPTLRTSPQVHHGSIRSQLDLKRYHFGLASSTFCLWPEVVKNIISAVRGVLHFVNTLKKDDADVSLEDTLGESRLNDPRIATKVSMHDNKGGRGTPKDTPVPSSTREIEMAVQCFILPISITLPPEGMSPTPAPNVAPVAIEHVVSSSRSKVPIRRKMYDKISPSAPPLQYRKVVRAQSSDEHAAAPTPFPSRQVTKDTYTRPLWTLDILRKHITPAQWRPALPFHGVQVRFSCLGENERVRPFERSRKKTYIQLRNVTLSLIDSVSSTFSTLSMQLQHVVFYNDNGLERKNVKCMAFQTEQIRVFSELDLEKQNILECQTQTRSAQNAPQSHFSVQHFATPDYSTTQVCILPTRVWASSTWLRVFAVWLEDTNEWYKAIMPALAMLTSSSTMVEKQDDSNKNSILIGDRIGTSPQRRPSLGAGSSNISDNEGNAADQSSKTRTNKPALELDYTQVREKLQVRVGSLQNHVNNTWKERPVSSLMLAHDGTLWLQGTQEHHIAQNAGTTTGSHIRQLFQGVAPSSLYVEQQGSHAPQESDDTAFAVLKIALYEQSEISDGLRQDLDFLWVPVDMESVLFVAFRNEIEMIHFTNAFARRLGYKHATQRSKVALLAERRSHDAAHADSMEPTDLRGLGYSQVSVRTSAASNILQRPTSVNPGVLRRGTKAAASVVGKVAKLPRQVGIHLGSPTPHHAESPSVLPQRSFLGGGGGVTADAGDGIGGDGGAYPSAAKRSVAVHSKRMNRVDISFLGLEVWIPASVPNAENLGLLTYGKVEIHSGLRERREFAITLDKIIMVHGKPCSTLHDKIRFHKDWLEETCIELSLTRERVVMKLEGFNVRIATGPYCQKALKVVWRELDIMIAFILLRQLRFFIEHGKDVVSIFTRSESRSRAFSTEPSVSDAAAQDDQHSLDKPIGALSIAGSDADPDERDTSAPNRLLARRSLVGSPLPPGYDRLNAELAPSRSPQGSVATFRETGLLDDEGEGSSALPVRRTPRVSVQSSGLNTIMEKDDDEATSTKTVVHDAIDTRPVVHKHALANAFFQGSPWLIQIDLGKGINICIGGGVESGYVKQQELTLQISPIQFQGLYPGPSDENGSPMEKFTVQDNKGNSLCSLHSLRGNLTIKCDVFNAVWGAGFGVIEPLTGVVKTLTAVSDKGMPSEITTTRVTLHLDQMMINVPYMFWDYMQAMLRELATLSTSATKGRPAHLRRYGLLNYTGMDIHFAILDAPYYKKRLSSRTLQKSSDVVLHLSKDEVRVLRTKCAMHGPRLSLSASLTLQGVKLLKGMELLKCVSEDIYEFCPVTSCNCSIGMRVCRRPADWNWGNEDKEVNYATDTGLVKKADAETGIVTAIDKSNLTCSVYWTHGFEYDHYRIGKEERYDLDCGLLALRMLELHLTRAETMMRQTQDDAEGHYTPPIPRAHVGFRRAMKISLDADLTIQKIGVHVVNIRIGCLQHTCPTAYRYLRYGYRILIEPISHAIQDSVCHMRISSTVTLVNHTSVPFEVMLNEQWMHETLRKAHSCLESLVSSLSSHFLQTRQLEKSNKLNASNGRPMTGDTATSGECNPHYHVLTLAPMSESQVPLEWFSEGGRATYIRPVGLLTNREPWRMFEPLAKEIEGDATSTTRTKELKTRYTFSLFFSRYLKFTGYTDYHDVCVEEDRSANNIARVAQTAKINISSVLTYRNMLPFPIILMVAPTKDAVADASSMTESQIRQVFKIGVRGAQFEERPYRTCCFRYSTAHFEWVPEDWGIRMATETGQDTGCLAYCMSGQYKNSSVLSSPAKAGAPPSCECAWYFLRVDEEIHLPFAKRHMWVRLILSPETPMCGSHSEEITSVWPNVNVRLKRTPQTGVAREVSVTREESAQSAFLMRARSADAAMAHQYAPILTLSDTYTIKQIYDNARVALSNGRDNVDLSVDELRRDYELAHGKYPFISEPLRLFLPSLDSVKPSVTLFTLTQKRDEDAMQEETNARRPTQASTATATNAAIYEDSLLGQTTSNGVRFAYDRRDGQGAKELIQVGVQCTRANVTLFVPYIVENLTSFPLYCLEAQYTHIFLPHTRILPVILPFGKVLSTHRPLHLGISWPYLDVKTIENISNTHEERKPMEFVIPRFIMPFLYPIKQLGDEVSVGELVVWEAQFLESENFRTTAEQFFAKQNPQVEEEGGMHAFHLNNEWTDIQGCAHWTGVIMRILGEQEDEYEITWVGVKGNMIVPKKYLMKAPGIPHSWDNNKLALSAAARYAQPPLSPHLTKIISISPSFIVINQLPEDFIVLLFYAVQTTPNALRFSPTNRSKDIQARYKSATRTDGAIPGLLQAMRPFHLAHGVRTPLVFPAGINFYFPCVYLMVARKSEPNMWTRSETFRVCPGDDSAIPDTRHVKWKTNRGHVSPKELIQVDINRGTLPSDLPFLYNGYFIRIMEPDFTRSDDVLVSVKNHLNTALFFGVKTNAPQSEVRDPRPSRKSQPHLSTYQNTSQATASTSGAQIAGSGQTPQLSPRGQGTSAKSSRPPLSADTENGLEEADTTVLVFAGQAGRLQVRSLPVAHRTTKGKEKERVALKLCLYAQYPINRAGLRVFPVSKAFAENRLVANEATLYCCRRYLVESLRSGSRRHTSPIVPLRPVSVGGEPSTPSLFPERIIAHTPVVTFLDASGSSSFEDHVQQDTSAHFRCGEEALCVNCEEVVTRLKRCDKLAQKRSPPNVEKMKWRELRDVTSSIPFRVTGHEKKMIAAKLCPKGYLDDRYCSMQLRIMEHADMTEHGILPVTARVLGGLMYTDCHVGMTVFVHNRLAEIVEVREKDLAIDYLVRRHGSDSSAEGDISPASRVPSSGEISSEGRNMITQDNTVNFTRNSSGLSNSNDIIVVPVHDEWVDNVDAVVSFNIHLFDRTSTTTWTRKTPQLRPSSGRSSCQQSASYAKAYIAELLPFASVAGDLMHEYFRRSVHMPPSFRVACEENWEAKKVNGSDISVKSPLVIPQGGLAIGSELTIVGREAVVYESQDRDGTQVFELRYERLDEEDLSRTFHKSDNNRDFALDIMVPKFSIAWVHDMAEILALRIKEIRMGVKSLEEGQLWSFEATHLQIDHFVEGTIPVVLNRRFLHQHSRWIEDKAISLTMLRDVRTHVWQKVELKTVPFWLNVEMGVFFRLYHLAQKDRIVAASDSGTYLIARKRQHVVPIQHPEPPPILAGPRVMQIKNIVITETRLTVNIRSPDDNTVLDDFRQLRLLIYLPLDMPNVDIRVPEFSQNDRIGSAGSIFSNFCVEYKRRAILRIGYGFISSYPGIAIKGILEGGWWLFRGPFDHISLAYKRELAYRESLTGFTSWTMFLSPWWVSPLLHGISEGFYRGMAEVCGNTFLCFVFFTNIFKFLLFWEVHRPRSLSVLDGMFTAFGSLFRDLLVTPVRLLIRQTRRFLQDYGKLAALVVIGLSIIRLPFGILIAVLEFLASVSEGFANSLLLEEAQFVLSEEQRKFDAQSGRAQSAGAWHSWADDNALRRSQTTEQTNFLGFRQHLPGKLQKNPRRDAAKKTKPKKEEPKKER
eukprot:GEMP01000009.1.p1 GENE.GEMP01000009.1~~GEMP01000009.1.p1  ORF type:complete len:5179 (+),score=1153.32 GEMP01000009.1:581-16117(+)